MAESSERSGLARRLRRLPGQLALALVNATAVLVIAAAVLVIVAFNRVEHAAESLSAAVTDAVLARVEAEPARLVGRLQATAAEIADLRTALREGTAQRTEQLERQIAALTGTLTGLRDDVKKLTEAKDQLADEAIRALGNSLTDGLLRLRNCRPVQAQLSRVSFASVMPGTRVRPMAGPGTSLVPGIHVFSERHKAWMAGTIGVLKERRSSNGYARP